MTHSHEEKGYLHSDDTYEGFRNRIANVGGRAIRYTPPHDGERARVTVDPATPEEPDTAGTYPADAAKSVNEADPTDEKISGRLATQRAIINSSLYWDLPLSGFNTHDYRGPQEP